jgi:hypothetical protein
MEYRNVAGAARFLLFWGSLSGEELQMFNNRGVDRGHLIRFASCPKASPSLYSKRHGHRPKKSGTAS